MLHRFVSAPCPRVPAAARHELSTRQTTRGHGATIVRDRNRHCARRLCPPYQTCSLKQLQIDRLRHRLITRIIWMKVVAAVIVSAHRQWVLWISEDLFEIDESV